MTSPPPQIFSLSLSPFLPLALSLTLLLAACANPIPPSGGPPDTTPPAIVETSPEADATSVSPSEIRITFSEYVDQNAFSQAFSINPEPEGRLEFDWSGRSVDVELPEDLRPNTTYILTLDTNLRDIHSVKLSDPITLAFSTGPRINRGRLAGRVVQASTGRPVPGLDVFAYAAPDSAPPHPLPDRPDYRIQTDERGRFQLDYLSEGPYFVVALADRNRSRTPDVQEPFAPPPRPILIADSVRVDAPQADSLRSDSLGAGGLLASSSPADLPQAYGSPEATPLPTWFTTATDTTAPALLEARALSSRRFVLRYSEPVGFAEGGPDVWPLRDSSDVQTAVPTYPYVRADAPQQVFLLAADSLRAATYVGQTSAVVDTSGNAAPDTALAVEPLAEADTTRLRFRGFLPDRAGTPDPNGTALGPREPFGLQFNQPVDSARLQAIVSVADTAGTARAFTASTPDGTSYRLALTPPLGPGEAVRVAVAGEAVRAPDTTFAQAFRRVTDEDLGTLSGVVAVPPDPSGTVIVELYASAQAADSSSFVPYAEATPGGDGRFLFERLPEGLYRFRAFLDRNGNRRWDGGRISPYRQPEPLAWSDAPPWRARWESALEDTLRLPSVD